MKTKLPTELPEDSVDQSLKMLRGIRVTKKADVIKVGSCEWFLNHYLDVVELDYREGWSDRINERPDLQTSPAYDRGYSDCNGMIAIKNSI
jgi:hypothetical protein